ncbi:MAG: tRNA (adenosine(37)-N6)-threonylcarbamoyltransferase complex ATPase subunit type 1 TsaE [Campylobacteraceae bacterium]|jgi:tRNA threonylcarbamoyladenosine biosynthesis protein TsaE|nr:tRNA (adenosine(37)-N6)-threonylcarbamoyltransferase complex ATPase subunit type 1 TsaE [Campylobacteraceae bacterium]
MTEQRFELKKSQITTVANAIANLLPSGGIVLLRGDLASGKTTLVKHIATLYGIKKEAVSSPTFSVMNRYSSDFFHYDIYQKGVRGIMENGLLENLQQNGYHFVEWGDEELEAVLKRYALPYIVVEIVPLTPDKRVYKVYNA